MKYQMFKSGPKKGQPKTLQDKVIKYLTEELYLKEIQSKSKYRQFQSPHYTVDFFVGRNGAVRIGKNASSSLSISKKIHEAAENLYK